MSVNGRMFDISVTLGEASIDYPGDTPYSCKPIFTIEENGHYHLSTLSLSAHTGTHIDAPAHFIPGGKTIDQYDIDRFLLPVTVLDIQNKERVSFEDVADMPVPAGNGILFRTDNSESGRCRNGVFTKKYVYLTKEVAKWCVERGAPLVGIDYISIDGFDNKQFETHHVLLSNNILILEGIDLGHVPPGDYTLFCLPLKIKGGEASPVRAILMEQE